MPKKSRSLYLGLATGGIPHSIRVTKKAATGLSVVFTFIKKHFNKAEKDQDLGKKKKKRDGKSTGAQVITNPTNAWLNSSLAQY